MDVQEVWEKLISHLKANSNIAAPQIDAFFSRTQVQAASPGFIMLTTENDFVKGWIQDHYFNDIKASLKALYGQDFDVMIEVDETLAGAEIPETPVVPLQEPVVQNQEKKPSEQEKQSVNEDNSEDETDVFSSSLTFESFVQGESNRTAYLMAVEVAESPGQPSMNPFYIYGRSGVGKTHLLCSIKNYINKQYPSYNVLYIDSQEMVSLYSEASRERSIEKQSYANFNKMFLDSDVLLVDDVQRLQGATETTNTFFDIFNNLIRAGKQIVLASDRAPRNIDLDERYTTRFNSGATINIQPPDTETKRSIVHNYLLQLQEEQGIEISFTEDIINYLSEQSSPNVRELKSGVSRLFYEIKNNPEEEMTLAHAKDLLANHFLNSTGTRITTENIIGAVEDFYKVAHGDLVSKKRNRNIAHPRQIAIYLMRDIKAMTYEDIAKEFNRNHSTIMHSYKLIDEQSAEDYNLCEELEAIREKLKTQEF